MSGLPKCIKLRVVSSDEKERSITIRKDYDDNSAVIYKSYQLLPDEFDYYVKGAPRHVLRSFINSGYCEIVGYVGPHQK